MKSNRLRSKPASIAKTRWLAYATAGAATALAGSNSAEAAIHYSGFVWEHFGPHQRKYKDFPLDEFGNKLTFFHGFSTASFGVQPAGPSQGGFVGSRFFYDFYVFKL